MSNRIVKRTVLKKNYPQKADKDYDLHKTINYNQIIVKITELGKK